jgi:NAD(P)H dehydrogenase (quinone)
MSGWAADLVKGENVEHVFDDLDASITIMRPGRFIPTFTSPWT